MVTNYPASHGGLTTSAPAQEEGLGVRVFDWLRQAYCAIHGHDTMLHFQHERMSLRCVSCGHETPGWALNQVPPRVKLRGDARRHALPRPHLVSARRIA
jgi:hypothetical protein